MDTLKKALAFLIIGTIAEGHKEKRREDEALRRGGQGGNGKPKMKILWYAFFRGELCRIRKDRAGSLLCEVWRKGAWSEGPDFAEEDFKGRAISEEEALEWMRSCFKEKNI